MSQVHVSDDKDKSAASSADGGEPGAAKGSASPAKPDAKERMDLPKWNRARVKRKQPGAEAEDAFQGAVRRAGRTTVQRAPLVLAGIAVVAAAIAGGVWLRRSMREDQAEATRRLADAVAYQARGEVVPTEILAEVEQKKRRLPFPAAPDEATLESKVEQELAALAEAAPDSEANLLADLVRAADLMKAQKFAEAVPVYRRFLDRAPADHALRVLAREGLVFALEAQGDLDGAVAEADALAGKPGDFYRDQALFHKGRLLERQDRKDEALEVYKQYIEEYPLEKTSIARDQVRERVQALDPTLVLPAPDPVVDIQ